MPVFLICEFDPLHYGHVFILNKARELFPGKPLVCVMSGNFTERGTPATVDKYRRAKAAVKCGADLVISIPFPYCSGSAAYFAYGAVSVINGFSTGGDLVFGSECADTDLLRSVAANLSSPGFVNALQVRMSDHERPFAETRQALYEEIFGGGQILSSRNDILALEYIKAAVKCGADLNFTPVKRDPSFVSSSEIRASSDPLPHLPDAMKEEIKAAAEYPGYPASYENFGKEIIYHLRYNAREDAAEGGHGVIRRLTNAAKTASGVKELFEKAASSAYTDAKMRRAALFSLLGVTQKDLNGTPQYTQLLAANERGLEVLSAGKKERTIKIITKPADAGDEFAAEKRADELYCMLTPKTLQHGDFMRRTPFILSEERK